MIHHIVLFKFKKSITEKEIRNLFDQIYKLSKFFPSIQNFSWGPQNNNEGLNKGFEYGFSLQFDSEETRKLYSEHPFNYEISETIVKPALENGLDSALVFDYFITKGEMLP